MTVTGQVVGEYRVPTEELRAVIKDAVPADQRTCVESAQFRRTTSCYSTSFRLEEIDVELEGGQVLELMFKDFDQRALLDEARGVRAFSSHSATREIDVYRHVLSLSGLQSAHCLAALHGERDTRCWLLLERVPGRELYQVGDVSIWCDVASALARMHGRFSTRWSALPASLLHYDADHYRAWLTRALRFTDGAGIRRLAAGYDAVIERLLTLPLTFIHGELYASNVLVDDSRRPVRVCPIDWEMAAIGPGLIDLAALTSGNWTDDQRAQICSSYRSAIEGEDVALGSEEFDDALALCRLHVCVQWLGWAPEWTPPKEHVHDWLGEALLLLDQVSV
ncbi:MAG TPA: phosphotransferase [Candidatus Sulfotelmatobacter sp.]|nr:phosphotransferase [Candidatus Sulfotelmatobacter sp.]